MRHIHRVCVLLATIVWSTAIHAEDSPPVSYDIPAGSLDRALLSWASQSRIQISYAPAQVSGLRTAGLRKRLRPVQALAELLQGSAVTALQISAGLYTLSPAPRRTPSAAPSRPDASFKPTAPAELAPVQVTGSRIPQFSAIAATPISVIDREQIESSGYDSLFDLLRTQPGMTGHAPISVAFDNGNSYIPGGAASATSLYALGPRSTLFLVEGRRIASYGLVSPSYGALTDLESIPLSMVERLEILRGGASAIYGADAMAGVVNILLRKDTKGGEATMRYGISEHGDALQRRLSVSQGFRLHQGNLLVSADRLERDALAGDARSWHSDDLSRFGLPDQRPPHGRYDQQNNLTYWPNCPPQAQGPDGSCRVDNSRYRDLSPEMDSTSGRVYLEQPLGQALVAYADLRLNRMQQRITTGPTSWQTTDTSNRTHFYSAFDVGPTINQVTNDQSNLALGVDHHGQVWKGRLEYVRNRNLTSNSIDGAISQSAFNTAVDEGRYVLGGWNAPDTLRQLSPTVVNTGRMLEDGVSATVDGTMFSLPGGDAALAAGVSARRQQLVSRPDPLQVDADLILGLPASARTLRQRTTSAYGELSLPLWPRLSTNAAARLDHTSPYGSYLSPSAGVKWQIAPRLTLRGSYGTGYRTPSVYELRSPLQSTLQGLTAPPGYFESCDTVHPCLISAFPEENPHLRPETSTSRTLGLVLNPMENLGITLDRFRIVRHDEIQMNQPLQWPGDNLQDFLFSQSGDVIGFRQYYANLARGEVSGWDASLRYFRPTQSWGSFDLSLSATRLLETRYLYVRGQHVVDTTGYDLPRTTLNAMLSWKMQDWTTRLNFYGNSGAYAYPPGQRCPETQLRQSRCNDPGQRLLGLDLAWSGVPGWQVALNIGNLTDHQPRSYRYNGGGYRAGLDDPYGRYYRISVTYGF